MDFPITHRVLRATLSSVTKITIVVCRDGAHEMALVLPYEELVKFVEIKEFIDSGASAGLSHSKIEFLDASA